MLVTAGDVATVPVTAGARRAPAERPRRTLHREREENARACYAPQSVLVPGWAGVKAWKG